MTDPVNINEIIKLVKLKEPNRQDIIIALTNSFGGQWQGKAYYSFVDSSNVNQENSEWQFDESIVLEHETLGTIVIDYLTDKRIGGIEFLKHLY